MANKFAWASIGENGKATGGKRGDQTGKEVKVGDYYDFGQNIVIQFKDRKYGRICGQVAKYIANDNCAGYNQSDRGSLYWACQDLGWSFSKIKKAMKKGTFPKCNCDCSSFAATCINVAYGKKLVGCFTTSTMYDNTCAKYPKLFRRLSVSEAKKKWRKGDFLLKVGKHVIINV